MIPEPFERRRVKLRTAAAMFDIGYDDLLEAVKQLELPAIKPKQAYLVIPDDVEAYLVKQSEEAER